MNSGSTGSNRKTLSQNTKAKISQAVKNAYARNETRARSLGMNIKTLRKIKKAHEEVMKEVRAAAKTKKAASKPAPKSKKNGTKKNVKGPVAPNFNPLNFMAMSNASATANKGNTAISNANKARRNKMSAAQKSSSASKQWQNNISRAQKNLGVSRPEAMVIAKVKRAEKAGSKKNANVNLLGLSAAPTAVAPAKKYNENVMSLYGM
jgi:hypothetical protein